MLGSANFLIVETFWKRSCVGSLGELFGIGSDIGCWGTDHVDPDSTLLNAFGTSNGEVYMFFCTLDGNILRFVFQTFNGIVAYFHC